MRDPASQTDDLSDSRSNPFSTRYTRPGQLKFAFAEGESASGLIEKLRLLNWTAQIVGPHGSGKSTLLATLLEHLPTKIRPQLHTLRDGQRRLNEPPSVLWEGTSGVPKEGIRTLLVIDGFEQLPRLRRWNLVRQCRRKGVGLLVTSHAGMKLPTLFQTVPSEALALALTERLLAEPLTATVATEVIASYQRQQGNYREMFFELYDSYAARESRT